MADEIDNSAKCKTTNTTNHPTELTKEEQTMRDEMQIIQNMIEFWKVRFTGLRTTCATSSRVTQNEIRALENKFIRMFAELLLLRDKMPEKVRPESSGKSVILQDWLHAVGLSVSSMSVVSQHVESIESLLQKNDLQLMELLKHNPAVREVEWQRLQRANHNLKRCCAAIANGDQMASVDLHWVSWDRHNNAIYSKVPNSPRKHRATAINNTSKPAALVPPVAPNTKQTAGEDDATAATTTALLAAHTRQTISPENTSSSHLSPSPSPPSSPSTSSSAFLRNDKPAATAVVSGAAAQKVGNFQATPPPRRKHQTNLSTGGPIHTPYLTNNVVVPQTVVACNNPNDPTNQLTKSKSHEAQPLSALTAAKSLANVNQADNTTIHTPTTRARIHTEPTSDDISTFDHYTLHVPRTPGTPGGSTPMSQPHRIISNFNPADINSNVPPLHGHKFNKKFKLIATCDQCNKQMFFGLKCKECKFRCHKDCEPLVRSTCGGFRRQLTENMALVQGGGSPQLSNNRHTSLSGAVLGSYLTGRKERKRSQDYNNYNISGPGAESSTESSCNSSTPSSPALAQITTPVTTTYGPKFRFPDVPHPPIYKPANAGNLTLESHLQKEKDTHFNAPPPPSPRTKPRTANLPDAVIIGTCKKPPSSPGPKVNKDNALLNESSLDTTDNTLSEDSSSKESAQSAIRVDSTEGEEDSQWSRQNSVSLKEWDIPFEDINLLEKIGDGRFGTVHRAQWHGAVAVKILKEDYLDTEAFRMEVATFKKTRHENVVLFMGVCIKPQAIVTYLCKGSTLYTHLHVRKDKFNMSRTTMVAHQIARGMGYLHDRSITHKDLKSKNIFIENGKVIITDFALFSATKLDYHDRMGLRIPRGWLPYLAPEIMQRLTPYPPDCRDQLPFSFKSDVFAFGTIWYELLAQQHPYSDQCAESIIFKVGRGMKPPLTNIVTTREVKEIMIKCWAYDLETRPDFAFVCRQLDMLPKKRLARSPSHPVQLSRSAESVF